MAMTQQELIDELTKRKAQGDPELANIDLEGMTTQLGQRTKAQPQRQQNNIRDLIALANKPQQGFAQRALGEVQDFGLRMAGQSVPARGQQQNDLVQSLIKIALGERVKAEFKSPLEKLIERAEAVRAARDTGRPDLARELAGIPEQGRTDDGTTPQGIPQGTPSEIDDLQLEKEFIDPGTGEPDPGVVARNKLKIREFEKRQNVIEKKAEAEIKDKSGDFAGRIALGDEGVRNVQEVRRTLFPDGTPESFRRGLAVAANPPALSPIGRLTPEVMPDLPLENISEDAQNVFRKMGAALSGRILIKTGVTARPEEVEQERAQFFPGGFSNPRAVWNALNELEQFYTEFRAQISPRQVQSQGDIDNESEPQSQGGFEIISVEED